MNILIVSQMFWPEHFLVNELTEELAKKGHVVTVFTGLPNYPGGKVFPGYSFWRGPWLEKALGATIYRTPLIPRGVGFLRLSINYASFILFGTLGLLRLINKKFDVSFVFATSPITAAIPAIIYRSFTKTPLVIWIQDLWPESLLAVKAVKQDHILYKCVGRLVGWIYTHCDVILVQSPGFENNVKKFLGNHTVPIKYTPNWFSPEVSRAIKPEWLKELPKGFKVCFAGNIGRAQAIETILTAAKLIQDQSIDGDEPIQFVIVGDGSELTQMKSRAKELSLNNMHFFGRKPVEDMSGLFDSCDALLVTLANSDIFSLTVPSKVQAYLAAGRPILASLDGEGAKVILASKAGLASAAENAQSLVFNIRSIASMSSIERIEMGLNGKKYFEANFNKSRIISDLERTLLNQVRK